MLVLAALAGTLAAGCAALLRSLLLRSVPARLIVRNFRGAEVPAVGGVVVLAALLSVEAVLALVALIRPVALDSSRGTLSPGAVPVTFLSLDHVGLLLLALGFFALGAVDDLAGPGDARGFRGHLSSLARGIVTGGAIKAFGGFALALVVGGLWELRAGPAVLDAFLIALSANIINLLDVRPGRATKAFLAGWVPLAAAGWTAPFLPSSAVVAAAALVWLPADLRERGMLGDAGANLLGGVLGAGLALQLPTGGKLAAAGGLAALTIVSEVWSFSSAIRRIPPLRFLDRLGRVGPFD